MSLCPQPSICGPESRAGCWVCQPDDEPDDDELVGHTRHPADQDQRAQENYYEMRDETL